MITIRYSSIDGVRRTKRFAELTKARSYAVERVGEHPEIGRTYAVSGDGIGKVEVEGATLAELFGEPAAKTWFGIAVFDGSWPHLVSGPFENEEEAQAAAEAWDEESFSGHQLAVFSCTDEYLETAKKLPRRKPVLPPFAVIEHHLVPDDFGGERGASRIAARFETFTEASVNAWKRNDQVEDGEDRSFTVDQWTGERWASTQRFAPPAVDAFDDMPF